ncbi:MAG: tetratricopeptide repeat protein, partial [Planctomycetota bacterium]
MVAVERANGGGTTTIRTPRKSKATRWRIVTLLAVHALIAIHVAHWISTGRTVSPLEPSEAMEFSKRSIVNAGLVFFAITTLSTLVLGRWFCGWACHLVALQDLSRALLIKVGLRPRPLRSRWLALVPILAAGYMFVWPLAYRMWIGDSLAVREVEMVREGYWDTFPTWGPAILTFFLCGFVAVYFLGAKGFCTYACPYGAVFGLADRASPGRIRVTDACVQCGHCSLTCTSNVDVSREVHDYGMVVDPGCMKCMDCVSVCPEDALYYGMGRPALFAKKRADPRNPRKPLPLVEEATGVLAFAFGYFAIRGYYQERGFLLSLGIAACFAFLAVLAVRLIRRADVRVPGIVLKKGGRIRATGAVVALATLGLAACAVPYGIVPEVHAWRADGDWSALAPARTRWFEPDREPLSAAESESAERLLASARIVRERSGVRSVENTLRLAWGSLMAGDDEAAVVHLTELEVFGGALPAHRLIAAKHRHSVGETDEAIRIAAEVLGSDPSHVPSAVFLLARLQGAERHDEARALIESTLAVAPDAPHVLRARAEYRFFGGDSAGAIEDLERALALEPTSVEFRDRLWQFLAQAGRIDDAVQVLEEGLALPDAPAFLRADLIRVLMSRGDAAAAAREARRLS